MKGIWRNLGWTVLILALLLSFCLDFANTSQGGAIDLRNRITGARLLLHGLDPYHYKWEAGGPEEFCDPFNYPDLPVSKTTASPALLLLHLPFALLPYRLGQFLWFFAQWLLLLGTLGLWLRAANGTRWRLWIAAFVVGFTCTAAWRLHAERGQSYVVLLFFFAWWLTATLQPKVRGEFLVGFLAGFLGALRPPFLLLIPFMAIHRRGQLAGSAVGLLLGIGLPMLAQPACWLDYFSAMNSQSLLYRTDVVPHARIAWPLSIEGVRTDAILTHFEPIPFADFSAHAMLRWLGLAPFPALPVALAPVAGFTAWLWFSRGQKAENLLAGLAAWFFVIDLFLPAFRNSYNDVLIINVVAAGLLTANRFPQAAWPCLLALPVGWWVYACTIDEAWQINLPSLLFTLGAILFLFFDRINETAKRRGGRTKLPN